MLFYGRRFGCYFDEDYAKSTQSSPEMLVIAAEKPSVSETLSAAGPGLLTAPTYPIFSKRSFASGFE